MGWWLLSGRVRRLFIDRSEPVKSGQGDRDSGHLPSEGQHGRGWQAQNGMAGNSPLAPDDCRNRLLAEIKCRRMGDVEALSRNDHPPNIYAFADYLMRGEEGPLELLFGDLWSSYMDHCTESNRRAMTPRQLQNAWKKVGHTFRDNTAIAPRPRWYVLKDDDPTNVEAPAETNVIAVLCLLAPRKARR